MIPNQNIVTTKNIIYPSFILRKIKVGEWLFLILTNKLKICLAENGLNFKKVYPLILNENILTKIPLELRKKEKL